MVLINTGFLYLRVVVNTILVLLSTRYVLKAIGSVDFGIYAVVAGIMGFLGFLTGAMATSSQRHLAYELGQKNYVRLNAVFNSSMGLHLLLSILIFVLAETLGLWFLGNVLNIPDGRQAAAFWVFQFTVVASISYVIAVPYQALFTAHESFAVISMMGILQSLVSFFLAVLLIQYSGDRLIIYALFSCLIAVSITLFQVFLSRGRYEESRLSSKMLFEKNLAKELLGFTGWNLFGALSVVVRFQGIAFLLNIFFGPVANAAMGIANQIYGAVTQFTQSILQVVSPRMVKHEGAGNREHVIDISVLTCKYSFVIGCLWSIPLIAEMPKVLQLWLVAPPDGAVIFCRLIILAYVFEQLSSGLTMPIQAIGRIAESQVVSGIIHISTLPLAYLLIKFNSGEIGVVIASLLTIVLNTFIRGHLLGRIAEFSYLRWLKDVLLVGCIVIAPGVLISFVIITNFSGSFMRLIFTVLSSSLFTLTTMYYIGMNELERSRFAVLFKAFKFRR